jgi:hypothetical protein
VTVNGRLWPAARVAGSESPPMLNLVLLEVAPVIVMLPPLAIRFPEAVALDPATTLPKASVAGLTLSWGAAEPPEPPELPVLTP